MTKLKFSMTETCLLPFLLQSFFQDTFPEKAGQVVIKVTVSDFDD